MKIIDNTIQIAKEKIDNLGYGEPDNTENLLNDTDGGIGRRDYIKAAAGVGTVAAAGIGATQLGGEDQEETTAAQDYETSTDINYNLQDQEAVDIAWNSALETTQEGATQEDYNTFETVKDFLVSDSEASQYNQADIILEGEENTQSLTQYLESSQYEEDVNQGLQTEIEQRNDLTVENGEIYQNGEEVTQQIGQQVEQQIIQQQTSQENAQAQFQRESRITGNEFSISIGLEDLGQFAKNAAQNIAEEANRQGEWGYELTDEEEASGDYFIKSDFPKHKPDHIEEEGSLTMYKPRDEVIGGTLHAGLTALSTSPQIAQEIVDQTLEGELIERESDQDYNEFMLPEDVAGIADFTDLWTEHGHEDIATGFYLTHEDIETELEEFEELNSNRLDSRKVKRTHDEAREGRGWFDPEKTDDIPRQNNRDNDPLTAAELVNSKFSGGGSSSSSSGGGSSGGGSSGGGRTGGGGIASLLAASTDFRDLLTPENSYSVSNKSPFQKNQTIKGDRQ